MGNPPQVDTLSLIRRSRPSLPCTLTMPCATNPALQALHCKPCATSPALSQCPVLQDPHYNHCNTSPAIQALQYKPSYTSPALQALHFKPYNTSPAMQTLKYKHCTLTMPCATSRAVDFKENALCGQIALREMHYNPCTKPVLIHHSHNQHHSCLQGNCIMQCNS